MDTRSSVRLVHYHPGRLRLRVDTLALDTPGVAERVRQVVQSVPGVETVTWSQDTGSLLIEYQPGQSDPNDIVATIAHGCGMMFVGNADMVQNRSPATPALAASDAFAGINHLAARVLGHRADLRTILPLVVVSISTYAFSKQKGQRLPRWDNLVYWSINLFLAMNRRVLDQAPSQTGSAQE